MHLPDSPHSSVHILMTEQAAELIDSKIYHMKIFPRNSIIDPDPSVFLSLVMIFLCLLTISHSIGTRLRCSPINVPIAPTHYRGSIKISDSDVRKVIERLTGHRKYFRINQNQRYSLTGEIETATNRNHVLRELQYVPKILFL